jgi:hypothetical protein
MGHLDDLLSRLDEDRLRRGKQFERVCRWLLTNDPLYQHQVRRVWLWDEWPGRWGADAGIDLVVEDREGGLWAVQAKAYDSAYSVTKADVDTFLSESSRPEFSYRLLIATTNRVHTFRHTCASMLFAEGRNVVQVQRWLGHHSAAFTLSRYVHLLDGGIGEGLVIAGGAHKVQPSPTPNGTGPGEVFTTDSALQQEFPVPRPLHTGASADYDSAALTS